MDAPYLVVIELSPRDPAGRLGQWLTDAGARATFVRPARGELLAELGDCDGVVCLGGPMGAMDDSDYPWLPSVRKVLADAVAARKPVLAVCLGAQLLAVATGGRVRRMPDGPEVGTLLVAKRDAAGADPLFAALPHLPDVVQFHQDEIDRLPAGAVLLAASPHCLHQAFRVGRFGYGLQFHIETTVPIVGRWARESPELAAAARVGELEPDHLAEVHRDIEQAWRPFVERFVRLAGGELAADDRGRTPLPLA